MEDSEDEREFDYEDDLDEDEEVDEDDEEIHDHDDREDDSGAELLPSARLFDLEATLHGVVNNMRMLHGPQSLPEEELHEIAAIQVDGDELQDVGELVDNFFDADAVIATTDHTSAWDIAMAANSSEGGRALYLPSQLAYAANPSGSVNSLPPLGPTERTHPMLRRVATNQGETHPQPSYSSHLRGRDPPVAGSSMHARASDSAGALATMDRSQVFMSVLSLFGTEANRRESGTVQVDGEPGVSGNALGAVVVGGPSAASAPTGTIHPPVSLPNNATNPDFSVASSIDGSQAVRGFAEQVSVAGRHVLGISDLHRPLTTPNEHFPRGLDISANFLQGRPSALEQAVRGYVLADPNGARETNWSIAQGMGMGFETNPARGSERWHEQRVRGPSSGYSILLGQNQSDNRNSNRFEPDGLFSHGYGVPRPGSRRQVDRSRVPDSESQYSSGERAVREEFASRIAGSLSAVRRARSVVESRRAYYDGLRAERDLQAERERKQKEDELAADVKAAEEEAEKTARKDAGAGESGSAEAAGSTTQAATAEEDLAGEDAGGVGGSSGDSPDADAADINMGDPEGAPLARIVEERAASVGVSLEAPANEGPDIVAAALASTGIDPTFLAALPEDMRTEVLTQHFERVSTTRAGDDTDVQSTSFLNQEFLIALPPALRADVLAQEADYRSRNPAEVANVNAQEGEAVNAGEGGVVGGAGADPDTDPETVATMLATADRELREDILLASHESLIAQLPAHLAAEARSLREREGGRRGGRSLLGWENAGGTAMDIEHQAHGGPSRHGANVNSGSRQAQPTVDPREAAALVARRMETKWSYWAAESRWIRSVPHEDHEALSICENESLGNLVGLLKLQSSQYGKSLLHSVLALLCKRTAPRRRILDLLFSNLPLPTSEPAQTPSGVMSQPTSGGGGASEAVLIRRTLEVLTNLCKHEKLVAEDVVAVPCNAKNAAGLPDTFPATGDHGSSAVTALVGLLSHPLFKRSSLHQEQLLSLLYLTFCAIPPPRAKVEDTSMQEHSDTAKKDATASGNEVDSSAEVDHNGSNALSTRGSGELGRADGVGQSNEPHSDPGSATWKIVHVPVHFRVPRLNDDDLKSLVDVLLQEGVSEKTYDRVTAVLRQVGLLPANKGRALSALSEAASSLGLTVATSFKGFVHNLSSLLSLQDRTDCVQAFSMAASADELKLLRVTKAISAVLKTEETSARPAQDLGEGGAGGEAESARNEDAGSSGEVANLNSEYFLGLEELWVALGLVLDDVRDHEKQHGQRSAAPASPSSRLEAEVRLRTQATLHEAQGSVLGGDENGSEDAEDEADEAAGGEGVSKSHSLSPALARLNPVMEAFFIYHGAQAVPPLRSDMEHSTATFEQRDAMRLSPNQRSSDVLVDESPRVAKELEHFIKRHRVAVNAILRVSPLLLDGSYAAALRHAHYIDFDNKKSYFRSLIRKRGSDTHAGTLRLNVRRSQVFVDSYNQLRSHTADEMRGRLHIQFNGEEGIDAGGVTREWYIILARQIFDPNYALFCRSAAKSATYQPNKSSAVNHMHLDYFRFVGRIFGKAIYDGQLLDAYFTRSFYKHILGVKPTYHDIEAEDPDYYKSLCWVLENDITGVLDYTFSSEYEEFGRQMVIDLKPDGRNIPVTEENKEEYVRLVTEVKLTRAIEKQIAAFKDGFHELIPLDDCRIFNEVELELLTSGLPDIDVADLKMNVEYIGFTAGSPQICWFWEAVGHMGQEDLARLVMFVTGTSKVPLEGFAALQGMNGLQKFQIHRASGEDKARLPSAHTCFNQLDLPEYESSGVLQERLLRAIRETVGFGFS